MSKVFTLLFGLLFSGMTFSYQIGEYALGGVIFWLDDAGQHGLVAAPYDSASAVPWSTREYPTGASSDGILSGKINTEKIINAFGPTKTYAAFLAASNTEGGYTDWYLPSAYELKLMHVLRSVIGGFSTDPQTKCTYYWTSNEDRLGVGKAMIFAEGVPVSGKVYAWRNTEVCRNGIHGANVRSVRSF